MLALATLTKPGPFASRTPALGEFFGVKEHGELIAMAGERMKHDGFVEVSGVCTHRARGVDCAVVIALGEASQPMQKLLGVDVTLPRTVKIGSQLLRGALKTAGQRARRTSTSRST